MPDTTKLKNPELQKMYFKAIGAIRLLRMEGFADVYADALYKALTALHDEVARLEKDRDDAHLAYLVLTRRFNVRPLNDEEKAILDKHDARCKKITSDFYNRNPRQG